MRTFRTVHLGIATAATAVLAAVAVAPMVGAMTPPPAPASFIPITPCRLADTRPAPNNVGTRATPIGENEVVPFTVRGQNGQCSIPTSATGIAANVTAVGATAASFVTLYPADAPQRPLASNLNLTPGAPPTPNQVTVKLSATGVVNAFNRFGSVDLIIDVVGFYTPASGVQGVIPSGVTVTGYEHRDGVTSGVVGTDGFGVSLPGDAPVPLTDATVGLKPGTSSDTTPGCTGTVAAPTAPPGMLCIYPRTSNSVVADNWAAGPLADMPQRAFYVRYREIPQANQDLIVWFSWAYTAP